MPASTFRFIPAAELELDEAARWYDERREGLGLEFLTVVREKVFALMEAPDRWQLVNGTRRALLEGFPYAVVYREVSDDEIEIVAVAHLRRRPKYRQSDSWPPNNGLKQTRISLRSAFAA